MRVHVDWRSASKSSYKEFCKSHPTVSLEYTEWENILYTFNDYFREYILETGEKAKLPCGIGEFSINKKKRQKLTGKNNEFINLPVDWPKTRAKGKLIYNFNFDTEGFFFGWVWFKPTARFRNSDLWVFKPCRYTSRLLAHYIKTDNKYQHIYHEWGKRNNILI